ncbi:tetratricopeptide repeat protein [bacterium]|nr:tetratricopeptide repeat protein [bacterium]
MGGFLSKNSLPQPRGRRAVQAPFFVRLLSFFALVGLVHPVGVQVPDNWQTTVRDALDHREFGSVRDQLNQVLNVEPTNLDAQRFQIEVLARRGQITNALAQIDRLITDHPDDRRSVLLKAQWLNQLGSSSRALAVYDRWLADEPGDIDMRIRRAMILRQNGELTRAVEELENTLTAQPDNHFARNSLLRTLIASGQNAEAWRRADEWDTNGGGTDAELGLIKASLVAPLEANELADKLASRTPADPDQARRQLAFRAMLLIREGRQKQGLELLAPYADLLSDDYDALFDMGNAYAAADRLNVARAYFQRAVSVTPQRPEARMGLARLASREGRLTDSLSRYEAIIAENPEALEASLGVIRIARLLDDFPTANRVLEGARQFAPDSVELFREELQLDLDSGNTAAFAKTLERYAAAQPRDPVARLWQLRWHFLRMDELDTAATVALLDPFSPAVSGQALHLLASAGEFARATPLAAWQNDESLPARAELFLALSRQMMLHLQRNEAAQFARVAKELSGSASDQISGEMSEMLAAGWWAYIAAPFAWSGTLSPEFDPQAISVWLAGQVQRRLRTFAIEAESPLEHEWLLRRAIWFDTWRDRWSSAEAAAALRKQLEDLVPLANAGITQTQIENAWRVSERWMANGGRNFNLRITRARWRQERFEFAGALEIYRRLASDFPDAAEPAQRQAVLLRGLGRTRDALAVLRELVSRPYPNPTARMEAAQMLTRLGEFEPAEQQLRLAAESGFSEPLFFIRHAELDLARGLNDRADKWIVDGLAQHPNAGALLAWKAGRLLDAHDFAALAELVRTNTRASWLTPDLIAAAQPFLSSSEVKSITRSSSWWFQWQWLPWERLEAQSIAALRSTSRDAIRLGQRERALDILRPATAARIPDADLWLAAGRMFDLNGDWPQAEQAYQFAHALGLGRPDADVAALSRQARHANPEWVAREFASRLEQNPDDFGLRAGLVVALLRAGEVAAADRALVPLVGNDPNSPAVRDLAAQVKGAKGQVREARSLYASILRGDPTDVDRLAAMRTMQTANQWGIASGYEFSDLHSTVGGADPSDWHEAYASVFWQQPIKQSWGLEYRWFERSNTDASHVRLDYGVGLDQDWVLRGHVVPSVEGDIIPKLKLGAGASRRVIDPFFLTLDFDWLTFDDLDVYQFAPGASWRWHPRSTVDTRVYLNNNVLKTGTSEWTATWVMNANWEFSKQSSARLSFAVGDESAVNPFRDLIGNDSVVSIGLSANLGLGRKWSLIPAWRYERHDRFDLNAFGLNVVFKY